jgi:hypothetical protein
VRIPACVVAAFVVAACSAKPPPAQSKPTPDPPAPKVEAPAPPPKCEAIDDHCVAKEGARARVVDSGLTFEPPAGWEYAQQKDAAIATSSGASLAMTTHDIGDPHDLRKQLTLRLAAFDALLKVMGVTPPRARYFWMKAPEMVKTIGALKVTLWQLDGASRDKSKGPLLIVAAPLSATKALIGAAYVPDDDKSGADAAILKAIDTLKTSDAPSP